MLEGILQIMFGAILGGSINVEVVPYIASTNTPHVWMVTMSFEYVR